MFYIVSYDVIDDKQRTKLAKKLCNYGQRVQYSVFECFLTKSQYKKMVKEILEYIDEKKDSLRIYQLNKEDKKQIKAFGLKRGFDEEEEAIIV